jgi:membrane associated rhomboid family serine protease
MSVLDNIKSTFQRQNKLTVLIILNAAVFLTVNIGANIAHINLLPFLALPLDAGSFIYKFWTIFTYMFTHANLGHAFFNLILLYFSGQMFFTLFTEKKLVYVYVMSGVFGGAILLLLGLIFPDVFFGSILVGASAAVMGIIMVMAVYAPNLRVNVFLTFEMPYKYFALIVFVLSTLIDFATNTGGKISHIGGAAFGLIYGYALKNGHDLFDLSFLPKRKSPLKVTHRYGSETVSYSAKSSDEKYLDTLLDKISKSGYDSLTKKEKDDLFKLSQKK